MQVETGTMTVNGIEYVRKNSVTINQKAESLDGLEYKIVRTYSAGVFAGYVKSRNGVEVQMVKARRLWSWQGAMELSDMAQNGVKFPDRCKFGVEAEVLLLNAIELQAVTDKAQKSIQSVAIWKA